MGFSSNKTHGISQTSCDWDQASETHNLRKEVAPLAQSLRGLHRGLLGPWQTQHCVWAWGSQSGCCTVARKGAGAQLPTRRGRGQVKTLDPTSVTTQTCSKVPVALSQAATKPGKLHWHTFLLKTELAPGSTESARERLPGPLVSPVTLVCSWVTS